jgi:hypothetical protein
MENPAASRPSTPPAQPDVAARAATIIAYAVALVGTGGGTFSLRAGDIATALIVWTTSLAVAATLVGLATLLRAVERLTQRMALLERDLRRGP